MPTYCFNILYNIISTLEIVPNVFPKFINIIKLLNYCDNFVLKMKIINEYLFILRYLTMHMIIT